MDLHGHIAIEGVIGAGKTTLATRLAERVGGKAVLEVVEENPFLSHFYRDRGQYAFQTQLFFLLSRHAQQMELRQRDIFHDVVVTDYIFQKDRIFANLNLSEHELALYDRIARLLEREVPVPELVIYLQAPTSVLVERIRLRGRPFERRIESSYLQELNDAYNYFFFHFDGAPLLIVNTAQIDFVKREDDFEDLLRQIERHKHGTAYYSPAGRV
ncbi:MAG: deoxynucleoside kinase [Candidatus Eiseniibacteriota bacterium]